MLTKVIFRDPSGDHSITGLKVGEDQASVYILVDGQTYRILKKTIFCVRDI